MQRRSDRRAMLEICGS